MYSTIHHDTMPSPSFTQFFALMVLISLNY